MTVVLLPVWSILTRYGWLLTYLIITLLASIAIIVDHYWLLLLLTLFIVPNIVGFHWWHCCYWWWLLLLFGICLTFDWVTWPVGDVLYWWLIGRCWRLHCRVTIVTPTLYLIVVIWMVLIAWYDCYWLTVVVIDRWLLNDNCCGIEWLVLPDWRLRGRFWLVTKLLLLLLTLGDWHCWRCWYCCDVPQTQLTGRVMTYCSHWHYWWRYWKHCLLLLLMSGGLTGVIIVIVGDWHYCRLIDLVIGRVLLCWWTLLADCLVVPALVVVEP
jgi:hypothetical protein